MKFFSREKITKQIVAILLVLMMSFTTFQPIVNADDVGGKLFEPIVHFLAFIADLGIELVQEFLWDGSDINEDNNYEVYIRTSNDICRHNSTD